LYLMTHLQTNLTHLRLAGGDYCLTLLRATGHWAFWEKKMQRHRRAGLAAATAATAFILWGGRPTAASLLYQWNFDGTTGAPAVTAGGGSLTITNATNGASTFASPGVSGIAGDNAYDGYNAVNQYNTANPAGIASTAAADVATGFGTLTQFTVTFWMKPNNAFPMAAQNGSAINARLMMAGTSASYDQGAGGLHVSLNGSDKIQKGVNGNNPISSNSLSTFLPANGMNAGDWLFVAFGYDGDTNNNVFFDPVIQAATGNADNNNAYVYVGGKSTSPVLFDTAAILATGNVSPGPVVLGNSAFAFLGNRSTMTRDFTGQIDDLRMYNNVLSATQLDTVRTSALVPEPATAALLSTLSAASALAGNRRRRRP
jgi:hypothetical protein